MIEFSWRFCSPILQTLPNYKYYKCKGIWCYSFDVNCVVCVQFCSGVDWSHCLLSHDEPLICKTNAMSWWVSSRPNAWINESLYLVKRVLSWALAIIIDAQFKLSLNINDWYALISVSLVDLIVYNDQDSAQKLAEGILVTCVSSIRHSACYVGYLSNSASNAYKIA